MMSRDEVHVRQHRDRLLALAESTTAHKPNNTKRRSSNVTKSPIRFGATKSSSVGPKLSIQDFVRADPGYTPNIEHLVFPDRKKTSPVKSSSTDGSRTRSRLAEMFALSRHLQQRSADRESKHSSSSVRKPTVNVSIVGVLHQASRIIYLPALFLFYTSICLSSPLYYIIYLPMYLTHIIISINCNGIIALDIFTSYCSFFLFLSTVCILYTCSLHCLVIIPRYDYIILCKQ